MSKKKDVEQSSQPESQPESQPGTGDTPSTTTTYNPATTAEDTPTAAPPSDEVASPDAVDQEGDVNPAVEKQNTSGVESQTGEYVPEVNREELDDEDQGYNPNISEEQQNFLDTFHTRLEDIVGVVRNQGRAARQKHMVTIAKNLELAATNLNELCVEFKKIVHG